MYHIVIQHTADNKAFTPKNTLLRQWVKKTLGRQIKSGEITVRIVGIPEMSALNARYRHKQGPTNVLSFPFAVHEGIDITLLGDIIICAEIVNQEAKKQNKSQEAHWAHMIIHGTLHLLGHDHETKQDAKKMESLEIDILHSLGFTNPYGDDINYYEWPL